MKCILFFLFGVVLLTSCADQYHSEAIKGPSEYAYSQVVFGHLASFIQNPDVLYKFDGNTLYTTYHLPSINLQDFPTFYPVEASDSLKNAIKTAFSSLPSDLTNSTSHTVGNYFPDVGYTYVQVTKDSQVQYWDLQATLPPSISSFATTLRGIMSKLP